VIRQSEIEIIVSECVEATVSAIHFREGNEDILPNLEAGLQAVVREELRKAGATLQPKRRAIVKSSGIGVQLSMVRNYLPSNYLACESSGTIHGDCILIEGYDRAGWTLDGYVLPRLASGLIVAVECGNPK
jgi:hypothetical protein